MYADAVGPNKPCRAASCGPGRPTNTTGIPFLIKERMYYYISKDSRVPQFPQAATKEDYHLQSSRLHRAGAVSVQRGSAMALLAQNVYRYKLFIRQTSTSKHIKIYGGAPRLTAPEFYVHIRHHNRPQAYSFLTPLTSSFGLRQRLLLFFCGILLEVWYDSTLFLLNAAVKH